MLAPKTSNTYFIVLFTLFLFVASSCSSDGEIEAPRTTSSNNITIDPDDTRQHIVGFGGANRIFTGAFPNEADMQKAYGVGEDELGLTIFRVSIPTNQSRWPSVAEVAKFAQDRGAIVFASPWDAPSDMLDPDHGEKRILPSRYDDYVEHLNSFDDFMTANGVNLHAISIQNEPDIGEWTQWSVAEVVDFVTNHAGGINNRVITAESFNFDRAYYQGILNDPVAVNNIDIVGGHIYGNGLGEFPLAEQKGKEIWMTEYLLNLDATPNWSNIEESLKWAETIDMLETVHEAMESNWNAYVWWYLKRYYSFIGEGEQGTQDGEILKRGYAFSHFSKFIRPGYNRIGLEIENSSGLLVTAYEGEGKIVVVMVNPTNGAASCKIAVDELPITGAISYTTSLTLDRSPKTLEVENNAVFPGIRPSSVTTVILEL